MVILTWHSFYAEQLLYARVGLVPSESTITTYIFQAVTTYRISSDIHIYIYIYIYDEIDNLYLPYYKPYIRNFQPIYNTVQHIFNDTTF